MTLCYVCPHRCGVDRPANMSDTTGCFGSCGVGLAPIVARAGLHMWAAYGQQVRIPAGLQRNSPYRRVHR